MGKFLAHGWAYCNHLNVLVLLKYFLCTVFSWFFNFIFIRYYYLRWGPRASMRCTPTHPAVTPISRSPPAGFWCSSCWRRSCGASEFCGRLSLRFCFFCFFFLFVFIFIIKLNSLIFRAFVCFSSQQHHQRTSSSSSEFARCARFVFRSQWWHELFLPMKNWDFQTEICEFCE